MTDPEMTGENEQKTEQEEVVEEQQEEPEPVAEAESIPASETAELSPQKPSDELKVVIIMKADRLMLGVQSPSCDPVYRTMTGSLAMALKKVPALVKEAREKWAATPLYPKAVIPEPPPSSTPVRSSAASTPAKPKAQPSFF